MDIRIKNFLCELKELTDKYNLVIGGCGCCGSPFIVDELNEDGGVDNLEFDYEQRRYKVGD